MSVKTEKVARRVADRGEGIVKLTTYTGVLLLHGMARLALIQQDEAYLSHVRELLMPFARGERLFACNFPNYQCGGNATAYLLYEGRLPEAADRVRFYAEEILNDAPRDREGILSYIREPDRIWIDVAFAVCPFLLFAGLAFDKRKYIDEACDQAAKMVRVLRDPANGLLHQCRNFMGSGLITPDHWGRGNGWGLLALAELANFLPADHPRRPEIQAVFTDLLDACLEVQDENGMWHQELPDPSSYVETSGTGLILYALGVALEKGLLPDSRRQAFRKGLVGFLSYIALDGSVHHTCIGCCSPGDGTVEAYKARPHALNDSHAFGPPVLAFGQAHRLGVEGLAF